jgi:hypothetical protein
MYSYPITVIDNFLENFLDVAKWGHSLTKEYHPERRYPGKRSQDLFNIYPEFTSLIYKKILNTFFENLPQYKGKMFFDSIEKNIYEEGWVHQDTTHLSFVIYLNQEYKNNCGTSMYKIKSPFISTPHNLSNFMYLKSQDFFAKKISEEGRRARKEYNNHYEEILNIPPLPNRCLIFPGSHPHSVNSTDTGTDEDRLIIVGYIDHIISTPPPLNRLVAL